MRKIAKRFDDIWARAERSNRENGNRYIKIFEQRKRYITMGIYDSKTKRYELFDTINLAGNFRYSPKDVPVEFDYMDRLVK